MLNLNIKHDFDKHLFFAKVKGGNAELDYDRYGDKFLDFKHTFVPEASRNYGVASTLVEHALDFARKKRLKIKATCPFIKDFIEKNPEYREVVLAEE